MEMHHSGFCNSVYVDGKVNYYEIMWKWIVTLVSYVV